MLSTDAAVDVDEATRLSTAPAPTSPSAARRHPLRTAWRRLTSMRTALLLLTLLALAAIPGTLLPQRGLNPIKVDDFLTNHPRLGPLLDSMSMFDVFAAPWFAAIYLLLFVSLIGCLVPRIRLHLRALRRRPPPAPRHLHRLATSTQWPTDAQPQDTIGRARDLLRRQRWRVDVREEADGAVSLGAEKGYLRETGNLVFHVSLLVLLGGIALGGLFGYKGTVLVVEGGGFANVRSDYDIYQPARLAGDNQLAPFSFTLRDFTASYEPNGQPRTFDARVDYRATPDAPATSHDIKVNHPLNAEGANVYLIGHGYALRLKVRDPQGHLVFDEATPFLPDDEMFASHGVIKVPDGLPHQLAFTGFFFPTYGVTAFGTPASTHPSPGNPVLQLAAWQGDLGLDRGAPQSVYELSPSLLTQRHHLGNHTLTPGRSWRLPDGSTVTFAGIREWATFQVAHDPGKKPVFFAAVFVVLGLLVSLRIRRRRVWLRAVPVTDPDGSRRTVVSAAGLTRSDADGFAQEFASLVSRMKD
jgi:cytochrome c biogenesis protein